MRLLTLDHPNHPPAQLAYQVDGETGSPVVLVMGLGFSSGTWTPQLPALASAHQVLSFDNRGVGETRAAPGRYRMEQLADDVVRLLDHLDWPDAHLAGVSMGGMIAQTVALRHRARVRSLALLCTHGGGFLACLASPRAQRWLLTAGLHDGERRLRALQELLFSPGYLHRADRADRAELTERMRPTLGRRIGWRYTLSQLHAMFRFRALARLGQLADLPTLVIQGMRDILIHPKHSERLHRALASSRLVSFPEGAHGLTLELAAPVNRLLLAHFAHVDRTHATR